MIHVCPWTALFLFPGLSQRPYHTAAPQNRTDPLLPSWKHHRRVPSLRTFRAFYIQPRTGGDMSPNDERITLEELQAQHPSRSDLGIVFNNDPDAYVNAWSPDNSG